MSLNYIKSGHGNIHIILDGVSYLIPTDHRNYSKIDEALEAGNLDVLREPTTLSVGRAIQDFLGVDFEIRGGELFYRSKPYNRQLGEEILKQVEKGYEPAPMLRFLEKCELNPHPRSVDDLFRWMQNVGLAMADDGDILGFKYVTRVTENNFPELWNKGIRFTDSHSKTFNYNPGETPEMPRRDVEFNPSKGCSAGLHVGTLSFVKGHDDILLVKLNPADVVSVPTECSDQKLRCCRFYVIQEFDPNSELFDDSGFSEPVVSTTGERVQPSEFKRSAAERYQHVAPANDNTPEGYGEFCDNPSASHWTPPTSG